MIGAITAAVFTATDQLNCSRFQSRSQLSTSSYHAVLSLHIREASAGCSLEAPKSVAPYSAKEHAQRWRKAEAEVKCLLVPRVHD